MDLLTRHTTANNIVLKIVTGLFMIILPVIGFAVGLQFPKFGMTDQAPPVACTMEARECPDGSFVGRQGPRCQFAPCPQVTKEVPSVPVASPSPTTISPTQGWTRTNMMSTYSFEYPIGYHVAARWPDSYQDGIQIWFSPQPLDFAPRGGNLEDMFLIDKSGLTNPEEELQKKIDEFRKYLTGESQEEIDFPFGRGKHIKGTLTSEMFGERKVEGYFLLIPAQKIEDKINYHVITTQIASDTAQATIIDKIVKSLKVTER